MRHDGSCQQGFTLKCDGGVALLSVTRDSLTGQTGRQRSRRFWRLRCDDGDATRVRRPCSSAVRARQGPCPPAKPRAQHAGRAETSFEKHGKRVSRRVRPRPGTRTRSRLAGPDRSSLRLHDGSRLQHLITVRTVMPSHGVPEVRLMPLRRRRAIVRRGLKARPPGCVPSLPCR